MKKPSGCTRVQRRIPPTHPVFQEAIVQTTIGEIDFLANTLKFRVIKFVYDGQRFAGKAEEKDARMKKCKDAFQEATIAGTDKSKKNHTFITCSSWITLRNV
jgi:hypothetical protein